MNQEPLSYEELEKKLQELEQQNHFLNCIFDAIPVNVFVKDTSCTYCYTNKICDMLNGVERGMLLGKTDFDLQHSDEIAQSFYDDDMAIMKEKKGSRMLSPTLCGSEIKYYDIFKEPVLDDDGSVMGIIGMVIDPNDSGIKNERLGTDYETYAEAFGDNESFVFDYSIESRKAIILKNVESYQLFTEGKALVDDIIATESIYEEDIPLLQQVFEKIHKGEEQISVVIRFFDVNGCLQWTKLSLNSVFDKNMNPVRAVGVIRPLADSVVAAERMRIAVEGVNKQMANVLGNRYDAFLYLNTEGESYHILEQNDGLHELKTNGTLAELDEFCKQYIHEEDLPSLQNMLNGILSSMPMPEHTDFTSLEVRFLTRNTYRWKEIDFFLVNEDINRGILLTIFDVDEVVKEKQEQKLKEINNGIIDILSTVVEFRSVESGDHINRIKGFTRILLDYVNELYDDIEYSPETMEVIASAAAMHDVGKIAIPDSILLKPGRLTPEEYNEMKLHTTKGCEILDSMATLQDKDYFKYSYEICRYHHERYDGKGYPEGLKGDEIPLAAQIVSVADVYDALISKRVYKDAYSIEEAYQMILNGECGTFSPKLMECFVRARAEMEEFSYQQFGQTEKTD